MAPLDLNDDQVISNAVRSPAVEHELRESDPLAIIESLIQRMHDIDSDLTVARDSFNSAAFKHKDLLDNLEAKKHTKSRLMQTLNIVSQEKAQLKVQLEHMEKKAVEAQRSHAKKIQLFVNVIGETQSLLRLLSSSLLELGPEFFNPSLPTCPKVRVLLAHCYLQHVFNKRLFSGFENEGFLVNEGASLDPDLHIVRQKCFIEYEKKLSEKKMESLIPSDPFFRQFCFERTSAILKDCTHDKFIGQFDLMKIINGGINVILCDLAKEVWSLHKLGLSMESSVRILRTKRGDEFDSRWMEVVNSDDGDECLEKNLRRNLVRFMVMPGFQVANSLVSPCRVYLYADCLCELTE
eukprot:Gb_23684 [translate_table: standard]